MNDKRREHSERETYTHKQERKEAAGDIEECPVDIFSEIVSILVVHEELIIVFFVSETTNTISTSKGQCCPSFTYEQR